MSTERRRRGKGLVPPVVAVSRGALGSRPDLIWLVGFLVFAAVPLGMLVCIASPTGRRSPDPSGTPRPWAQELRDLSPTTCTGIRC